MTTDTEKNGGWTCLELHCSGQQLERAIITFSRTGVVYRVTCGPLSNTELARLERVAATGELVRLIFPKSAVTLSHVTVECPKPGWAQLEGRVVGPTFSQQDASRPSAST